MDNQLNPYKGLDFFSEDDAPFFFGRDKEQEIITANLLASRLTLLYGESGVGKSSLLRAGVQHNLNNKARESIREYGTLDFMVVVFKSWRGDPIANLQEVIAAEVRKTFGGIKNISPPPASPSLAENLRKWTEATKCHLLILFDQFEEYFIYHPKEDGEGTFAVEFPKAVNDPSLRVNFILSFRQDSLAKLDFFQGRIENIFNHFLRVDRLGYEEARDAIRGPINKYNELFQQHYDVEEKLIDEVLEEVRKSFEKNTGLGKVKDEVTKPSEWKIETPYLQLVMKRLWEEELENKSHLLRLDTFNGLGRAETIVQEHFDSSIGALKSEEEKELAYQVFLHLITPSRTKIAQAVPDLAEYADSTDDEVKSLLEQFAGGDRRILRTVEPLPNQREATRYEIFHDILSVPILDWVTNRKTKKESDEREKAEAQLAREKSLSRRLRMAVVALSIALAAAIAATIFAYTKKVQADTARVEADKQKGIAEEKAEEAKTQAKRAEDSAADANIQRGIAETNLAEAKTQKAKAEESAAEANRQAKRAKDKEEEANTQRGLAETNAKNAKTQKDKAEKTLAIINTIDESTPYSRKVLRDESGELSEVKDAAMISDDRVLVVTKKGTLQEGILKENDPNSGKRLPLKANAPNRHILALSPDRSIAVAYDVNNTSDQATYDLVDVKTGDSVLNSDKLQSSKEPDPSLVFNKDGNSLVMALNQQIYLLNKKADGPRQNGIAKWNIEKLPGKASDTNSVLGFSPNGEKFATKNRLDDIVVWNTKGGMEYSWRPEKPASSQSPNYVAETITRVAFNPKGTILVTGKISGEVAVWDISKATASTPPTRIEEVSYDLYGGHSGLITSIEFSPDGKFLATASSDGTVRVYFTDDWTRATYSPLLHDSEVRFVRFSPNSEYMISGDRDGLTRVWQINKWNKNLNSGYSYYDPVAVLQGHINSVNVASFSKNSKWLVTGGEDSTVRAWDLSKARGLEVKDVKLAPPGPSQCPLEIGFSGKITVEGGKGKLVYELWLSDGRRSPQQTSAFAPLGNSQEKEVNIPVKFDTSFTGSAVLRVFDSMGEQILAESPPVEVKITCAEISDISLSFQKNSAEPLLTGVIGMWISQLSQNPANMIVVEGHRDPSENKETSLNRANSVRNFLMNSSSISGGQILVKDLADTCAVESWDLSQSRRVVIWSVPPGRDVSEIERLRKCGSFITTPDTKILKASLDQNAPSPIYVAAFSPDAKLALLVGKTNRGGNAQIYDLTSLENPKPDLQWRSEHKDKVVTSADFNRKRNLFLTAGEDGSINIYDAASRKFIKALPYGSEVSCAVFSPDGQFVAAGGSDGSAKVWDITSGRELSALEKRKGKVNNLLFTPDGRYIALGCDNGETALWETQKWTAISIQNENARDIQGVAFSPDGRLLATACDDNYVRLWDWNTPKGAQLLRKMDGHDELKIIAFSPDGKYIVAGRKDEKVTIWEVSSGQEVTSFVNNQEKVLTPSGDHKSEVRSVAFSADGQLLIAAGDSGKALVYDFNKLIEQALQKPGQSR